MSHNKKLELLVRKNWILVEQVKRLKNGGCNCQCGGIGDDGTPCPNPCMATPPCDEMELELRQIDEKLVYMK